MYNISDTVLPRACPLYWCMVSTQCYMYIYSQCLHSFCTHSNTMNVQLPLLSGFHEVHEGVAQGKESYQCKVEQG